MTRQQKEQYALDLYQKGKTVREISQLTHMSFREIGAVTRAYKQEIERENGQLEKKDDIKSKSEITQAIKLFSEGKNLIDVVIALNLQPDEVQEIYRQFLKLKDMRELVEVYDEMQNYLPSLLELFRLIVHRELDKNDIITVTNAINTGQLQYMKKRIQNMTDAVNWLDNQIEKKEYYLKSLNNRICGFSHGERSIIPMTNNITNDTFIDTYSVDKVYSSLPDDISSKPLY